VAVGMLHALRISKKYFGMYADEFIDGLLQSRILPGKELLMELLGASSDFEKMRDDVIGLLLADKKSKADSSIGFVLLKAPGEIARVPDDEWSVSFKPDNAWDDIAG
jgi:3-dehydroquinate synthetase